MPLLSSFTGFHQVFIELLRLLRHRSRVELRGLNREVTFERHRLHSQVSTFSKVVFLDARDQKQVGRTTKYKYIFVRLH